MRGLLQFEKLVKSALVKDSNQLSLVYQPRAPPLGYGTSIEQFERIADLLLISEFIRTNTRLQFVFALKRDSSGLPAYFSQFGPISLFSLGLASRPEMSGRLVQPLLQLRQFFGTTDAAYSLLLVTMGNVYPT